MDLNKREMAWQQRKEKNVPKHLKSNIKRNIIKSNQKL